MGMLLFLGIGVLPGLLFLLITLDLSPGSFGALRCLLLACMVFPSFLGSALWRFWWTKEDFPMEKSNLCLLSVFVSLLFATLIFLLESKLISSSLLPLANWILLALVPAWAMTWSLEAVRREGRS